jgi:hypothetical protein
MQGCYYSAFPSFSPTIYPGIRIFAIIIQLQTFQYLAAEKALLAESLANPYSRLIITYTTPVL